MAETKTLYSEKIIAQRKNEFFYRIQAFLFRKVSKDLTLFLENNEKIWIGAKSQSPHLLRYPVLFAKGRVYTQCIKVYKTLKINDINLITSKIIHLTAQECCRRLEGNVRVIYNEENLHFWSQ